MSSILKPKRGQKVNAEAQALFLQRGEVFFEVGNNGTPTTGPNAKAFGKIKMGDGINTYANLGYFIDPDTTTIDWDNTGYEAATSAAQGPDLYGNLNAMTPSATTKTILGSIKALLYKISTQLTSLGETGATVNFAVYDESPALYSHDVGDRILFSDSNFYIVTQPIALNDIISVGTNIAIDTSLDNKPVYVSGIPDSNEETVNNTILLTLTAGETEVSTTNNIITNDSTLEIYTSIYGVAPLSATIENNTLTLTFDEQESDMVIKVVIK